MKKIHFCIFTFFISIAWTNLAFSQQFNLFFASRVAAANASYGIPLPAGVNEDDTLLVTVTVDNGGSSINSQSWAIDDVVSVKFDVNNGTFVSMYNAPHFPTAQSTGTIQTDGTGNITDTAIDWEAFSGEAGDEWFLEKSPGDVGMYRSNNTRAAAKNKVEEIARWGAGVAPAFPPVAVAPPPASPTSVPTLSFWGLLLMTFLLGAVARRQKK